MTDTTDAAPAAPGTPPAVEPDPPTGQQPGHALPGERRHEHLRNFPPVSDWDHHVEYDAKAHPRKVPRSYMLVPTMCFNCESGLRAARLRGQGGPLGQEARGQPGAPRLPRAQLRQGPGHDQPDRRPRADPASAAPHGDRGAAQWEQVSWDTPSTTSPRRIRAAILERRHEEVMYHVGRPGEDGFAERFLAAVGGGRAQHPYQRLLLGRPARDDPVGRLRPPLPRPRQRQGHPAALQPPGDRPLLQPARPADHGGQAGRREARRDRPADVQHRQPRRPLARRPGRAARPRSCSRSPPTCCAPGRIDEPIPAPLGQLDRPTSPSSIPDAESTFEMFLDRLEADYAGYTPEFAAEEAQVPVERITDAGRAGRRSATTGSPPTSGARRRPATWAAGRSRAALWFVLALTGSIGTAGGTSPNGWNKFIPHGPDMPAAHDHWNELNWPREYPTVDQRDVDPAPALPRTRVAAVSRSTSRGCSTRSGPIPTGSPGCARCPTPSRSGCHVALTPTWSETAEFADYVLPMGHCRRAPRHPLLRDPRRALARIPPAGAARRDGEARTAGRRHP